MAVQSIEMHNNVFYRMGGGPVRVLQWREAVPRCQLRNGRLEQLRPGELHRSARDVDRYHHCQRSGIRRCTKLEFFAVRWRVALWRGEIPDTKPARLSVPIAAKAPGLLSGKLRCL